MQQVMHFMVVRVLHRQGQELHPKVSLVLRYGVAMAQVIRVAAEVVIMVVVAAVAAHPLEVGVGI